MADVKIFPQMSMVFHLDKCIGCHTCSVACKNTWTDRKGTEYMWWNNVETKPGTGYPFKWEDQDHYKGGWSYDKGKLKLMLGNRVKILGTIFFNPSLPTIKDYYEPWTYDYELLTDAPASKIQPTARTKSMITNKPIDVQYGPNWDDDLAGSEIYARNDPDLEGLTEVEREQLHELERLVFFYLPRICNHCANAACAASCPSGAIYKRGEDGVVLINQERCRGWRMCISGCPYKKVYFNWRTGKSEKCILCYPKLESGKVPACFHTCVGRIRYLGVLLCDSNKIDWAVRTEDEHLVARQQEIVLDPFNEETMVQAKRDGLADSMIEFAQRSPVYKFFKKWEIALPLHPEYRTLPMVYYVPPLLPVIGKVRNEIFDISSLTSDTLDPLLFQLADARLPIRYMANLFSAKNEDVIRAVYEKLIGVRTLMRQHQLGKRPSDNVVDFLAKRGLSEKDAHEIFHLTSKPTYEERFVIPPLNVEMQVEPILDPEKFRHNNGFGFLDLPVD